MKRTIYILFLVLIIGCNPQNKKQTSNSADRLSPDSSSDSKHAQSRKEESGPQLDPAGKYIGLLEDFYFLDNNEIYIELYFVNDQITSEAYEEVVNLGDSVIFSDDENRRTRIPRQKASKHLDLRGIDSITIYSRQDELIETVKLKHIEYLDQNISPQFIAVFETDQEIALTNDHYCIGNYNQKLNNQTFISHINSRLSNVLASRYSIDHEHVNEEFRSFHFKHIRNDSIISCLNSNESVMIFLSCNNESSLLYKSMENENIIDIFVLPIKCNGLPLLLTESVKPESDMRWNSLLAFDGKKYAIKERQKIKISR